jgi:hypothetical protein
MKMSTLIALFYLVIVVLIMGRKLILKNYSLQLQNSIVYSYPKNVFKSSIDEVNIKNYKKIRVPKN